MKGNRDRLNVILDSRESSVHIDFARVSSVAFKVAACVSWGSNTSPCFSKWLQVVWRKIGSTLSTGIKYCSSCLALLFFVFPLLDHVPSRPREMPRRIASSCQSSLSSYEHGSFNLRHRAQCGCSLLHRTCLSLQVQHPARPRDSVWPGTQCLRGIWMQDLRVRSGGLPFS
jgi:hypothetical protein